MKINRHIISCASCPYKGASSRIFPEIKKQAKVLLVFQAPGVVEQRRRAPLQNFASPQSAASRIAASWKRLNLKRESFDITNCVLCFPGKSKSGRDKSPSKTAILSCSNNLKSILQKRKYTKIIVFGSAAKNAINLLKLHPSIKRVIVFCLHPCGGLKSDILDKIWI